MCYRTARQHMFEVSPAVSTMNPLIARSWVQKCGTENSNNWTTAIGLVAVWLNMIRPRAAGSIGSTSSTGDGRSFSPMPQFHSDQAFRFGSESCTWYINRDFFFQHFSDQSNEASGLQTCSHSIVAQCRFRLPHKIGRAPTCKL